MSDARAAVMTLITPGILRRELCRHVRYRAAAFAAEEIPYLQMKGHPVRDCPLRVVWYQEVIALIDSGLQLLNSTLGTDPDKVNLELTIAHEHNVIVGWANMSTCPMTLQAIRENPWDRECAALKKR